MTIEQAFDVIGGMAHLKFFPQQQRALDNLAEMLLDLCKGTPSWTALAQAKWLVSEIARTHDEYPGPKTMREIYHQRFAVGVSAYKVWEREAFADPGFDPAIEAEIQREQEELERKLKARFGGTFDQQVKPEPPPITKPITEADFARVVDRRKLAAGDGE